MAPESGFNKIIGCEKTACDRPGSLVPLDFPLFFQTSGTQIPEKPKKMLDVIIVNYESTDFLQDCLSSLSCSINGHAVNIIVFDNNSTDSPAFLSAEFPRIRFIQSKKNVGFAAAVNWVLENTKNPYILLLNPDTIVFPGFFDNILSFLENNEDTGIVGTQILDADGSVQGSARAFPSFHTALFGRSSIISKLFPNNPMTCANILTKKTNRGKAIDVDWVSGACMAVRREAVDAVGPMDESFFMYWEDADWCSRMWKKGWKVKYWPGAKILHYVGGSSSKNLLQSVFTFHKSAFHLYRKHNPRGFNLLEPFVFLGLAFRCAAVLGMHGLKRPFSKPKAAVRPMVDDFGKLSN